MNSLMILHRDWSWTLADEPHPPPKIEMPFNPLKQSLKRNASASGFFLGRLYLSHSNLSCDIYNLKFRQPLPIQSHLILLHLIPSNSIDHLIAMADNTIAPKNDHVLPPFSLRGKTAVVSGAGAEIGLAVTQGFAEARANVVIWYNSNKRHLTVLRILGKHTASSAVPTRSMSLTRHW